MSAIAELGWGAALEKLLSGPTSHGSRSCGEEGDADVRAEPGMVQRQRYGSAAQGEVAVAARELDEGRACGGWLNWNFHSDEQLVRRKRGGEGADEEVLPAEDAPTLA